MQKYQNLKSIKSFYKKHQFPIVMFIIFTVLSGAAGLLFPFTASNVIIYLTDGQYDKLVQESLVLFAFIVTNIAMDFLANYFYAQTSAHLFLDIRKETISKTMEMNLSTIYDKGSGFFLERLSDDCREMSVVHLNIYRSIINLVINLGFIAYITVLNPLLGLVFGIGLIILIILEQIRITRLLANMKKQKRAIEKIKSNEAEILKGIKEIKALNAKDAIVSKHTNINNAYMKIRRNREFFQSSMGHGISFVKALTDLAILLFSALYLLPNGQAELAAVLVIYNFKGNIYDLIAGLARIKDYYVNGELSAKRLNDILLATKQEKDTFGTKILPNMINSIEFKDVNFGYIPEQTILEEVSFKIDQPGVIGFVGKSGSGKSTIFSLLSGFYDQRQGEILLNGTKMELLDENYVKDNITSVLQDPHIFNDTVYNNILLSRVDATEEEVYQAAKLARIDEEIMAMKDAYQTIIGENGATISGGQRQRLEIARALLKNSKVMLFDEATSALDKKNLDGINDLLIELGQEKIIFVIAHRLGVMRRCSKVVVLDQGKIIAIGSHQELMQSCAYYQELFNRSSETEKRE